jgi:uncharacterized membrane protein YkvA (DUF1232 family)
VKLFRTIASVRHEIPRIVPLFRDARVPAWAKAAAVLAAVLIVSPLDLLGDIPLLGFFDDGALLLFVVHLFVSFAEKRTQAEAEAIVVR